MAVDQITLTAETGRKTGTRDSKRLRASGKIPAVVYGTDTEPTAIAVDWSALRAALTTDAGMNALITLDVDGDEKLTIVWDMQRHPVRREVTHVDFITIDRNKPIDVDVPVVLEVSEDDHLKGLVIDQQLFSLPIAAKPGTIPNEFLVSLDKLTIDDPIRVGDLTLPDGVELNIDPEEPVVTASPPMALEDLIPTEAEEEVEGEEGEGEEAAEGEAAEGGDEAEAGADEAGDES